MKSRLKNVSSVLILFVCICFAWGCSEAIEIEGPDIPEIKEEYSEYGYYITVYTTDKMLYSKFLKDRTEADAYFLMIKDYVGIDKIEIAIYDILWEENDRSGITWVSPEFVGVPPEEK